MGVMVTGTYLGGKRVKLVHGPSGASFHTAAPLDNQGDGSSFSPTDLVAAALGSCMLTTMAIFAERERIQLGEMNVKVEKNMSVAPRRIAELRVEIELPSALDARERGVMEAAALGCPVHRTVAEETKIPVEFRYLDTLSRSPKR